MSRPRARRVLCLIVLVLASAPGAAHARQPTRAPFEPMWLEPLRSTRANDGSVLRAAGADESVGHDTLGTTDVDADGLHDVVTYDLPWQAEDERLTVRAVRGIDGAGLWTTRIETRNVEWVSIDLTKDLTGDGAGDVVITWSEQAVSREECLILWLLCTPSGAPAVPAWHGRVLSGADGSIRWEDSRIEDRFHVGEAPTVIGDLTGDGLSELAIEGYEPQADSGDEVLPSTQASAYSTRATVISIAEDREWHLDRTSELGYPILLAVGDTVGDARADLAWEESWRDPTSGQPVCDLIVEPCAPLIEPGVRYRLTMLDGSSGEAPWMLESDEHGTNLNTWSGFRPDLDGDGRSDLFQWFEGGAAAFSGDDGRLLWRGDEVRSYGWQMAEVGDVDGDGTVDLAIVEAGPAPKGSPSHAVFLSGRTGDALRRWTFPEEGSDHPDASLGLVGDLDADGTQDLGAYRYGGSEPVLSVYAGRTAATLLEWAGDTLPDGLLATGDLHPAPGDELLLLEDLDDSRIERRLLNLGAGTMWSAADAHEGFAAFRPADGDLDGGSGADLLIRSGTRLDMVSSADGQRRWSRAV